MMTKKDRRIRRAGRTRRLIANQGAVRLAVHRTNLHTYATIISGDGSKVIATVSTTQKELAQEISGNGGNVAAAVVVGKAIAKKALAAGIESLAFDRSGNAFHGRVKALAEAVREAGVKI